MSVSGSPRVLSPRRVRWMLNLFPPLFFGRIRVTSMSDDFLDCTVMVRPSVLTRNLQGSIFGGTIFSSADPFHAIMYWQALARRGIRVQAWLRTASIRYLKPATTALTVHFVIAADDINEAVGSLKNTGRFVKTHRVEVVDANGQVCAVVDAEVYLRTPRNGQRESGRA